MIDKSIKGIRDQTEIISIHLFITLSAAVGSSVMNVGKQCILFDLGL